jgi:hypothetical protein
MHGPRIIIIIIIIIIFYQKPQYLLLTYVHSAPFLPSRCCDHKSSYSPLPITIWLFQITSAPFLLVRILLDHTDSWIIITSRRASKAKSRRNIFQESHQVQNGAPSSGFKRSIAIWWLGSDKSTLQFIFVKKINKNKKMIFSITSSQLYENCVEVY